MDYNYCVGEEWFGTREWMSTSCEAREQIGKLLELWQQRVDETAFGERDDREPLFEYAFEFDNCHTGNRSEFLN